MAYQKVERDLPAELQIYLSLQHGIWMKFDDQSTKKVNFDQTLEARNFANNRWNFLKPRLRTFLV